MKTIKEKQMFVKWAKAMNQPIDNTLLEEVDKYEKLQNEILESVRGNALNDIVEASHTRPLPEKKHIEFPKPPTLDEVLNVYKEETNELVQPQTEQAVETSQPPTTKPPSETLIDKVASHITKEVKLEEKADSYQQPDPHIDIRSLNDVKKKIKFLEEWVGKISLAGPGGGAGDVINLDMPTKLVTGDYTITRRDYYVGVNCSVKANITLPDPSTIVNGREVIIKDESGHAQLTPIKVIGTVDNDPNGFEIRINNGSVTLIYRDGWRIV
jgi:hypothetical protein